MAANVSQHEPFYIQVITPGKEPVRLRSSVRESRAMRQFEQAKRDNPQANVALIPPARLQQAFLAQQKLEAARPKRERQS